LYFLSLYQIVFPDSTIVNLTDAQTIGTHAADLLNAVRNNRPLVHHITNTVTINDCANITLSVGAAPVMAGAIEEVAEMAKIAGALVLNIGTLTPGQVDAMIVAAEMANRHNIPVILDPVGAGSTRLRTASAELILEECTITILKGNRGEIGVLAGSGGTVRGVDSGGCLGDPIDATRICAEQWDTTTVMTGDIDIVVSDRSVYLVRNGHPMMDRLSGTGCMAASVTAAFAAVSQDSGIAAAAALAAFGFSGEIAGERARGPYSFRIGLVDALSLLAPEKLQKGARIEVLHEI